MCAIIEYCVCCKHQTYFMDTLLQQLNPHGNKPDELIELMLHGIHPVVLGGPTQQHKHTMKPHKHNTSKPK